MIPDHILSKEIFSDFFILAHQKMVCHNIRGTTAGERSGVVLELSRFRKARVSVVAGCSEHVCALQATVLKAASTLTGTVGF